MLAAAVRPHFSISVLHFHCAVVEKSLARTRSRSATPWHKEGETDFEPCPQSCPFCCCGQPVISLCLPALANQTLVCVCVVVAQHVTKQGRRPIQHCLPGWVVDEVPPTSSCLRSRRLRMCGSLKAYTAPELSGCKCCANALLVLATPCRGLNDDS